MDNYEFETLVESNFPLYLGCLLLVSIVYYFLYRKIVFTILDPFFIYIVSTVFAIADVLIMAFTKAIKPYYISSFLFSQSAFLLGFYTLKGFSNKKINFKLVKNLDFSKSKGTVICIVFFVIFFVVQCTVYYLRGIPILFDSRLDYYNEGGGFGVMARILGVLSMFVCFLIFKIAIDNFKTLSTSTWFALAFMFLFYLLTQVLSGGKSAVLTPITILFSYLYISDRKHLIKKISKKYFFLIVLFSLSLVSVIILIQSGDDSQPPPWLALIYRLVVSGDVYWYVYPNDVIKTYHIKANGFVWLFNDFLGLFRLISWSDLGTHPGIYFYNYHHPTDATRGPNIRHNVFGLMYFGYYGGIFYSFCLGLMLSFFRFVLVALKSKNIFFKFSVVYLFINCTMIEPDVTLFFLSLNNLLIMLPILFLITVFIQGFLSIEWEKKLTYL